MSTEKLTNLALDVFNAELACWEKVGTQQHRVTRLVRYPKMAPIGESDIEVDGAQYVSYLEVEDKDVNDILARIAMEAVVKAIEREICI